ncbi:septum formation initiator family protein [bacterium]|nr:septum formation initiator family protein [bacterium]
MRQRKKNYVNKIIFNQVTMAIIGFCVIVAVSIPLARNVSKQYKINREVHELQGEIAALEAKNDKLGDLIDYLDSNHFIDEQARINLGLRSEGEELVIIKEKQSKETAINDKIEKSVYNIQGFDHEPQKKIKNNPQRWLEYFLKVKKDK